MKYPTLLDRFLVYVKENTRSDESQQLHLLPIIKLSLHKTFSCLKWNALVYRMFTIYQMDLR